MTPDAADRIDDREMAAALVATTEAATEAASLSTASFVNVDDEPAPAPTPAHSAEDDLFVCRPDLGPGSYTFVARGALIPLPLRGYDRVPVGPDGEPAAPLEPVTRPYRRRKNGTDEPTVEDSTGTTPDVDDASEASAAAAEAALDDQAPTKPRRQRKASTGAA
jgi:hypothetical protein